MSTQLTRILSPSVALAIAAGLALAACNREAPKSEPVAAASAANVTAELSWARAALERNPDLEVVATDPQSGVVTVKHRSTGEVEAIKASELAAATPSQLKPMNKAEAPPPVDGPRTRAGGIGAQRRRKPRRRRHLTRGSTARLQSDSGYTIDRSGGQIRVSGPGVSIVSSGTSAAGNQAGRRTPHRRSVHLRRPPHAAARQSRHLRGRRRHHGARRLRGVPHQQSHRRIGHRHRRAGRDRPRLQQPHRRRATRRSRPTTARRCTCAARRSRAFRAAPSSRWCRTRAATAGDELRAASRLAVAQLEYLHALARAGTCAGRDRENPPRRSRGSPRPSGRPARARTDCAASARRRAPGTP